jgi:hypothetical protein
VYLFETPRLKAFRSGKPSGSDHALDFARAKN